MKTYRGDRTIDGIVVTVDDQPLSPQCDLKTFTDRGFEWSFEGVEPLQLALALLADHLGDNQRALSLCNAFMSEIVANFNNEWEMTSADIDIALKNISVSA